MKGFAAALLVFACAAAGCGYQLVDYARPDGVTRRVALPTLRNDSYEPGVDLIVRPLCQQVEAAWTVERIHQRLRGDCPDAASRVRAQHANSEEAACDRDAEFAQRETISRDELLARLKQTLTGADAALAKFIGQRTTTRAGSDDQYLRVEAVGCRRGDHRGAPVDVVSGQRSQM